MTYKRSTVLTLKSFLLFFSNFGSTPKNLHLVAQVLPNSNLNFKPCCGIRNPRKFCLWNPESWVLESGIKIKESGIPITIGIQNSSFFTEKYWNPVRGIQNPESSVLEPGIQIKESGIPITIEIQNSTFFTEKYWNPVPGIRNPHRGIQNPRLCWIIPLHGVKDEYL